MTKNLTVWQSQPSANAAASPSATTRAQMAPIDQPIEKQLLVPLPPDMAFELFTQGIDLWWPKDRYSLAARNGNPASGLRVEPHLGGRIVEIAEDGQETVWADIVAWQPGVHLGLKWQAGTGTDRATDVVVTFAYDAEAGGTRVLLVHSGFADHAPAILSHRPKARSHRPKARMGLTRTDPARRAQARRPALAAA